MRGLLPACLVLAWWLWRAIQGARHAGVTSFLKDCRAKCKQRTEQCWSFASLGFLFSVGDFALSYLITVGIPHKHYPWTDFCAEIVVNLDFSSFTKMTAVLWGACSYKCQAYNLKRKCFAVQNIRTADWSEEVAPFWGAVIKSAVSADGIRGLFKAGWTTIKVPHSFKTMTLVFYAVICWQCAAHVSHSPNLNHVGRDWKTRSQCILSLLASSISCFLKAISLPT